jgi:hypothetical protein
MKALRFGSVRLILSVAAITLTAATAAYAGPPLICHPIAIGQAKSLYWTSTSWNLSGNQKYDLKRLVPDTLAILDSNAPVLVRMETLRRATLYARKDAAVAKELLTRLHGRATSAENAGRADALAWFDLGYLTESYKQWIGSDEQNPAAGFDGSAWVKKAIHLRGQDSEMEFAAALITLGGPEKDHREHVQRAMAGAKQDPLLAQNLTTRFSGNQGETISKLLVRPTPTKNPK